MTRIMTRSNIDLSLLMSPVHHDSQQHGSVIVNGICSSTKLFVDNDICSSIDLFINNTIRSSIDLIVDVMTRSSIDLSLLMSPVHHDSQQLRSVSVNDFRSSTDPSALTVFAAASIYQRYRHSQQHGSAIVDDLRSNINPSAEFFAATSIYPPTSLFAVVLNYPLTAFFAAV